MIKNIADPVFPFEFSINEDKLFLDIDNNMSRAVPYHDERLHYPLDNWLILRAVQSEYIQKIVDFFEVPASPRFYILEPNTILPEHVDHNTTCSINFVLGDDNPAPVFFGDKKYFYKNAVLNTKQPHGVINDSRERVILKLSIFDLTFEEVCTKVKHNLLHKQWS